MTEQATPKTTTPTDPTSPLQEAALAMHEVFKSLIAAGFTRRDTIDLIARMLANSQDE